MKMSCILSGIGTANIFGKLHVASGNNQLILEGAGPTDAKKWLFGASLNLLELKTSNDTFGQWVDWLVVERRGVSVVDVSFPSGQLGVGTLDPAEKLDVAGRVKAEGLVLAEAAGNVYVSNSGLAGDASTIRLGTKGTHARTFIAGISGITTGGAAVPVVIDAEGQLGTLVSSRRFKKDIRDIAGTSSKLMHLRPVSFRYAVGNENRNQPLQYGLIAEEVAEVFPEMVQFSDAGEPTTVMYQFLPSLLLNELQKQRGEIERQEAEIADLKARLAALERAWVRASVASATHDASAAYGLPEGNSR